MAGDDLLEHATSKVDFYELLGVVFETSTADIKRAYRKTALKYHPDKVGATNTDAIEKFHLLSIAQAVLLDPVAKAAYDNARAARIQKERQDAQLEGRRRQMKEDLERRETGVKRKRTEAEEAEERLQREINRLAEDGKRRRQEKEERLTKEKRDEEEKVEKMRNGDPAEEEPPVVARGGLDVPEIDRTVKVRWAREDGGETVDKEKVQMMFTKFGEIESTFLLKDKKQRVGDKHEKKVMATGVIVFKSIVGAHTAVEDIGRQEGSEWEIFDSVYWAANKEPESIQHRPSTPMESSAPSTPLSQAKSSSRPRFSMDNLPSTPVSSFKANGAGLRKVPSFASFSSANASTPYSSPFSKTTAQSPSLEEITMIRLKNAEKKRLEEQIRKQDETEAATEAS
ncbi:DnaJ domain-containing protein [Aulographum hederae CBS 113979]|uniref:DnaJ domain-containing protein n=1 Tax=Aulographum hederae CBS 113979 TaxID=1176131 RepID=A0A6G1HAB2_9PEZI|nr:DnaJ domain-containing protein [Aulographum hederae CBS 113979]